MFQFLFEELDVLQVLLFQLAPFGLFALFGQGLIFIGVFREGPFHLSIFS